VLYGCEIWSLTMREERGLRVFENNVQIIIFGTTMDKVIGEWIKLHNEELNDPNFPLNMVGVIKIRRMKWAGHVESIGEVKCLQHFGC